MYHSATKASVLCLMVGDWQSGWVFQLEQSSGIFFCATCIGKTHACCLISLVHLPWHLGTNKIFLWCATLCPLFLPYILPATEYVRSLGEIASYEAFYCRSFLSCLGLDLCPILLIMKGFSYSSPLSVAPFDLSTAQSNVPILSPTQIDSVVAEAV